MSRGLVDRKMAKVVKEKIFDHQLPVLTKSVLEYSEMSSLNKKQTEAIALLIAGASHTFNFLGRRVHEMEQKKVDLSFEVLAEALQLYIDSHSKK